MEAHGSILQSALELLRDEGRAPGESVYVALDAIASRESCRRAAAHIHRIDTEGAVTTVTTVTTVTRGAGR
eukprot:COSAG01_NODE_2359_length_7836_cov_107.706605_2_plen_71_part_00